MVDTPDAENEKKKTEEEEVAKASEEEEAEPPEAEQTEAATSDAQEGAADAVVPAPVKSVEEPAKPSDAQAEDEKDKTEEEEVAKAPEEKEAEPPEAVKTEAVTSDVQKEAAGAVVSAPVKPVEEPAKPSDTQAADVPAKQAETAVEAAVDPQNPAAGVEITVGPQLVQEAADALDLLSYIVSSGYVPEDGRQLSPATIAGIKNFAAALGLPDRAPEPHYPTEMTTDSNAWIAFEGHYRDLTIYAAPITAETLHYTELKKSKIIFFPTSTAQRFAWLLWIVTFCIAALIIYGEWKMQWFGPGVQGDAGADNKVLQYATIMQPYLYGALGACAYLLRSAHTYVYKRTFDMRRTSEYFNRILLGTVSGGAIIILINTLTDENGKPVQIGAAALGFIAGYSTDFLFNTVERIVTAIMPKIEISSLQKRPPPPIERLPIASGDLTLKDLLDRHQAATGAEKELYASLIQKLAARM